MPRKKNGITILILCLLSLFFFVVAKYILPEPKRKKDREMAAAARTMAEAAQAISRCSQEKNVSFDDKTDVNHTGLIGLEYSPLTTSLGNLEAKRTTTNPNFAALLVLALKKAGIKKGETIAAGASCSFPALIVAALSASKAMDLKMLMICSLGASQWGANNPHFTWLDMQKCLFDAGIFRDEPIAFSLGGEQDIGKDMPLEGRSLLIDKIKETQAVFLEVPDLKRNVRTRMRIYKEKAGQKKIKAFINIGGNWANLGRDPEVLKLRPGLVSISAFPQLEKQGVIHEMARDRIPVIHLLYIRGLAQKYGLPWDPSPLPQPGEGKFWEKAQGRQSSFFLLTALYFLFILLVLILRLRIPGRGQVSSRTEDKSPPPNPLPGDRGR